MNISHINSTFSPHDILEMVSAWFVVFLQVVNFFLGIPLNIYVIVLLNRAGGLDESVLFTVSQSVSEILYALSAPLYLLCVVYFCYIIPLKLFNGMGMIARFMFLCLVCVERYLAVVHPVTFLRFKPLKYRLFCLIVAWICLLTCSITFIFVSNEVNSDFVAVFYTIIVIVELFCCVSILKVLKQPAPGKRADSGINSTKKKAFKIVIVSLLIHLTQLLPMVIIYILRYASCSFNFHGSTTVSLAINIAVGLMPPLFFLQRAGKLKIPLFCHIEK